MASREHTPVVRWTPRRFNAALRCPKPTGAIARFHAGGTLPGPARKSPLAAAIASFIARHADFLAVPSDGAFENRWELAGKPSGWLLVPATTWLVDALSNLDAEQADLEPGEDAEPDADAEPDEGAEPDVDGEEVAPIVVTADQRRRYREGDCVTRAQDLRRARR